MDILHTRTGSGVKIIMFISYYDGDKGHIVSAAASDSANDVVKCLERKVIRHSLCGRISAVRASVLVEIKVKGLNHPPLVGWVINYLIYVL